MRAVAVTAASALGLALGFSFGNIGPIADLISIEYGIGLVTVGVMTMAVALVHALAQIPSGRIADRFGARRVALAGIVVVVVTNALALIAPSAGLAIGMRLLMGLGTGAAFIAGTQYVRTIGPVAQGTFGGAALGGAGLAIAVMPTVATGLGWRAPWIASIVVLGVAFALLVVAPRGPPALGAVGTRQGSAGRRGGLFHDPALYRLGAMHMASMGLSLVVANWIVTMLTRTTTLTVELAGALGSMTLLLGMATRPLGGWLMRRRPEHTRTAIAVSLTACAAGTILVAAGGPVALPVVGAALIGFWAGIPFAPVFQGASQRRPEAPGTAVGLVNMMANGVVVIGTPLLGLAFSAPLEGRIGFFVVATTWVAALLALPRSADFVAQTVGGGDRRSGRGLAQPRSA